MILKIWTLVSHVLHHVFQASEPRKRRSKKKGQSLRIDPFEDLRAQLSGMMADVIVEEGSNEEIGMVITRMSPDFALLT